jgi:hypothetical protein
VKDLVHEIPGITIAFEDLILYFSSRKVINMGYLRRNLTKGNLVLSGSKDLVERHGKEDLVREFPQIHSLRRYNLEVSSSRKM